MGVCGRHVGTGEARAPTRPPLGWWRQPRGPTSRRGAKMMMGRKADFTAAGPMLGINSPLPKPTCPRRNHHGWVSNGDP